MAGRSSRDKGARGELEVAAVLRAAVVAEWERQGLPGGSPEIARTPNSGGLFLPGDVGGAGLNGVHVEAKRCERLDVPGWLAQTYRDCPAGSLPVLAMRRNKQRGAAAHPLGAWHALVPLEWAAGHLAREIVARLVAESD